MKIKQLLLTALLSTSAAVFAVEDSGEVEGWRYQISSDPITDEDNAFIEVDGDWGSILTVYCEGEELIIYFGMNDYISEFEGAEVDYRLDKNAPVSKFWQTSRSRTGLMYPNSPDAEKAFLKELLSSSTFALRTYNDNDNPITRVWDLSGMSAAYQKIKSYCKTE
ncbi:hypothetical protein OLMES_0254 [Oleiphilus messinensis]|uniref:Uncharacterized protein n=1 Tax=Oleiphilus messinensis TaxID=141451 RepID=A0A1Y0I275_9GAMM|nr:hypothetical protein [Oleiphilus messinensis]ARU54360.1 hypothetical protein OLMES_0254 [Oleiphilus messinensis]